MRPFVVYSLARVGVFLAVAAVLYPLGFRSWALTLVALLLSMPLSYVLLRRQRLAFAASVADRLERRAELRRRMSTETDGHDDRRTGPG